MDILTYISPRQFICLILLPVMAAREVAAQSSDVLSCGAAGFPALRSATYRSDEDAYGDLDLVDMELDYLELDAHSESHLDALFGQLAGMRRAGTLALVAWDDLLVDSPLPCERLEISVMERDGCVQLDLASLRLARPARGVAVHQQSLQRLGQRLAAALAGLRTLGQVALEDGIPALAPLVVSHAEGAW